jgi:hypothetical protein
LSSMIILLKYRNKNIINATEIRNQKALFNSFPDCDQAILLLVIVGVNGYKCSFFSNIDNHPTGE